MDMRIKTITLFLALVSYAPCFAQLSIEACYEKARANYPLIKQYGLIEKTKEYNLSNAAKGYLPQVTFSAQATYQSDVTEIPIDLDAIGLTGKPSARRRKWTNGIWMSICILSTSG